MNVKDDSYAGNATPIAPKRNVTCNTQKLKSVLAKFILPSFKASDDTVLQKLHDYLCFSSREGCLNQELLGVLLPWLGYVMNNWSNIHNEVKSFVLRVVGKIVNDSKGFNAVNERGILLLIISNVTESDRIQNNCIALAYVDLLYSLLNNAEGSQWIIDKEFWKEVLQFSLKSSSIYVRRRSQQLISNFIITLIANPPIFHSVMLGLLEHFGEDQKELLKAYDVKNPSIIQNNNKTSTSVKDIVIELNCYNQISQMLLTLLESGYSPDRINDIFGKYGFQNLAWNKIHSAEQLDIILAASKFLCVWNICVSFSENDRSKYSDAKFSSLATKHFNLLITRQLFPKIILETCVEYSCLWSKYSEKFPGEKETSDFTKVENLIFLVQALPMFLFIRHTRLDKSEVTVLFVDKLFNMACPALLRLGYHYRDQIRASQISTAEFTHHVINSFIRVSSSCTKEQAVLIFQGFIYLLKDFSQPETFHGIPDYKVYPDNLIKSYPDLLAALVNGLSCYLTKFKFSWRESLETVCIMSLIQNLITNPDVPYLVSAEILKLTKLILLHFMPPNLVLLIDTLQDSSMGILGKQLFKTLGSVYWEVRDSSLEVLQVLGWLAQDKFPAFQTLLLENDLPNVIVSVVKSDCEAFVRASALSCLSEFVKVQSVWDTYLHKEHILELILSLLYFETEGIVRTKAAMLIKDIVKHRSIPEDKQELVYDTLYHVAQNDLHWEVKLYALDFWDEIREQSFISVGMVDGCFPDAIFSKEKKKIIKVTNTEKSLRIIRALSELSQIGCLKTLLETLHDNCDIEVQRKSVIIIKKIVDVVSLFDVFVHLEDNFTKNGSNKINDNSISTFEEVSYLINEEQQFEDSNKTNGNTQQKSSHDVIIDGIVAESDINLLSSLVQLTDPVKKWPKVQRINVSPKEFLAKIKSMNFDNYIADPSTVLELKWNLESLLDDILLYSKDSDEDIDKNCIDCY